MASGPARQEMTVDPDPDARPDVHEARAYRALQGIDRAGLMWEWLRRDRGYMAWYARASAVTRSTGTPSEWGLHFR